MKKNIETYHQSFQAALQEITTLEALEDFRIKHLGRQGMLAEFMHQLKELPLEEKKVIGPLLNTLKQEAEQAFNYKQTWLEQKKVELEQLQHSHFDVTAYTPFEHYGSLHPYTHVIERAEDIFMSMGFEIGEGPELETDYYNFFHSKI